MRKQDLVVVSTAGHDKQMLEDLQKAHDSLSAVFDGVEGMRLEAGQAVGAQHFAGLMDPPPGTFPTDAQAIRPLDPRELSKARDDWQKHKEFNERVAGELQQNAGGYRVVRIPPRKGYALFMTGFGCGIVAAGVLFTVISHIIFK